MFLGLAGRNKVRNIFISYYFFVSVVSTFLRHAQMCLGMVSFIRSSLQIGQDIGLLRFFFLRSLFISSMRFFVCFYSCLALRCFSRVFQFLVVYSHYFTGTIFVLVRLSGCGALHFVVTPFC